MEIRMVGIVKCLRIFLHMLLLVSTRTQDDNDSTFVGDLL